MDEVLFLSSRWRTFAYVVRCETLNAAMLVLTYLAPWPPSTRLLCVAAIAIFAVAWGPWRYIGTRVRVLPDYMEYIDRHGRVERMPWGSVTHYNLTAFHLRVADASQRLPVLFAKPLLIRDRATFRALLLQHCPAATGVTRVGWWRLVFGAASDLRNRTESESRD